MTVETSLQLSLRTVYLMISRENLAVQQTSHLNTLGIHLVILFHFGPVQTGIPFLADEQIRPVDLFEFKSDRFDEFCSNKFSGFTSCKASIKMIAYIQ